MTDNLDREQQQIREGAREMPSPVDPKQVPFIYNLFPPLGGEVTNWPQHVERAAGMGYNWLFLNPVQFPGESGSLYSVRDYDRLNPLFFPQAVK
ncbi:MAG: hypothetical protein JXA52_00685, partial [Planctomycetes bacterium]|nr:hypothetical protein [Planctomycetota bacterium]